RFVAKLRKRTKRPFCERIASSLELLAGPPAVLMLTIWVDWAREGADPGAGARPTRSRGVRNRTTRLSCRPAAVRCDPPVGIRDEIGASAAHRRAYSRSRIRGPLRDEGTPRGPAMVISPVGTVHPANE